MKEKQLIKLCQKGDSKAFELLVHKYSPTLMGICMRYMKDETAAKDALQECFITIFRNIQKYQALGSFEGWLKRIAVTSSLKELRKKKSNVSSLTMIFEDQIEQLTEEPVAIQQLEEKAVLDKINSLPEEYRIVFNLYIIEGFSYKEIAELLGLKETSCRMRLSRARKKLHSLLLKDKDYYGFERTRKVD